MYDVKSARHVFFLIFILKITTTFPHAPGAFHCYAVRTSDDAVRAAPGAPDGWVALAGDRRRQEARVFQTGEKNLEPLFRRVKYVRKSTEKELGLASISGLIPFQPYLFYRISTDFPSLRNRFATISISTPPSKIHPTPHRDTWRPN